MLSCPRCGRDIDPDDLHTGVCWSCGLMVDMDRVIDFAEEGIAMKEVADYLY